MKERLFIFVSLLVMGAIAALAQDFYVDGFQYRVNSDGTTVSAYGPASNDSVMTQITTAIIPASVTYEGTTYTVTAIPSFSFNNLPELTVVQIPATVTSIDYYTFRDCPKLKQITVQEGNPTYDSRDNCQGIIKTASNLMVVACKNTSIPSTVTALGEYCFAYCPITDIHIPQSIKSIGRLAFCGCSELTSLTIPASVKTINNGLTNGCSKLTSLTVEEGNTKYDSRNNCNAVIAKSTNILVAGCPATVIPDGVVRIGKDAFHSQGGFTEITIPNSVQVIDWNAFEDCTDLTSVHISPSSSLTTISMWAFCGCHSLSDITFPEGLLSIQNQAFLYCDFKEIRLPASLKSLSNTSFEGCDNVTKVTVDPANVTFDSRDNCNAIIHTESNTLMFGCVNTVIPNTVVEIGNNAFYYCTKLKSIDIPSSVKVIGQSAFEQCYGLENIDIPNSVTTIDYEAFYNCPLLKKFVVPASVISLGNSVLARCPNLEEIRVEEGNTVYDSRNDCNAIIETSTKTLMSGCKNTMIPDSIITIAKYAFWGAQQLREVTIPASVTAIDYYAFTQCDSLSHVISLVLDPNDITTNANAFVSTPINNCTLYVPHGSVELYRNAPVWSRFGSIVEIATVGDVDGNYIVNGADVTSLYNRLLDGTNCKGNPDVNGDGTVNGTDVTALYNLLLN